MILDPPQAPYPYRAFYCLLDPTVSRMERFRWSTLSSGAGGSYASALASTVRLKPPMWWLLDLRWGYHGE
jgi:hypothetical protein